MLQLLVDDLAHRADHARQHLVGKAVDEMEAEFVVGIAAVILDLADVLEDQAAEPGGDVVQRQAGGEVFLLAHLARQVGQELLVQFRVFPQPAAHHLDRRVDQLQRRQGVHDHVVGLAIEQHDDVEAVAGVEQVQGQFASVFRIVPLELELSLDEDVKARHQALGVEQLALGPFLDPEMLRHLPEQLARQRREQAGLLYQHRAGARNQGGGHGKASVAAGKRESTRIETPGAENQPRYCGFSCSSMTARNSL